MREGPAWGSGGSNSLGYRTRTDPGTSEPGAELSPYPPVRFIAVHHQARTGRTVSVIAPTDPGTSEPGAELNPYPSAPAFMTVHFIARGPDGSHGTGYRRRTPGQPREGGEPGRHPHPSRPDPPSTGAASGVHPSPYPVRPARAEGGGLPGRTGSNPEPARAPRRSGPPGRVCRVIVQTTPPCGTGEENSRRESPIRKAGKTPPRRRVDIAGLSGPLRL